MLSGRRFCIPTGTSLSLRRSTSDKSLGYCLSPLPGYEAVRILANSLSCVDRANFHVLRSDAKSGQESKSFKNACSSATLAGSDSVTILRGSFPSAPFSNKRRDTCGGRRIGNALRIGVAGRQCEVADADCEPDVRVAALAYW